MLPMQVGELCVRGYSVMLGYWGDLAATAGAIDEVGCECRCLLWNHCKLQHGGTSRTAGAVGRGEVGGTNCCGGTAQRSPLSTVSCRSDAGLSA